MPPKKNKDKSKAAKKSPSISKASKKISKPTPLGDTFKKHSGKNGYKVGVNQNQFSGTLRGKPITLKNVQLQKLAYLKRAKLDLSALRKKFDSTERKNFIKQLASNPATLKQLKDAGIDDAEIKKMNAGFVPKGYQVHHKIPLDGGGTNDASNLVLIKNDPYHIAITVTQNSLTKGLQSGETKQIGEWPVPMGAIYQP